MGGLSPDDVQQRKRERQSERKKKNIKFTSEGWLKGDSRARAVIKKYGKARARVCVSVCVCLYVCVCMWSPLNIYKTVAGYMRKMAYLG